MSFNNFLSTSTKRDVSLKFAINALGKTDMVGILFQMSIDPSVSSTPFAAIREVSYFQTEEEILLSMHTVFRIGLIKQIDSNNPLYQVDLQLTSDDDPQLRALTERIRKETPGSTGWQRLGQLLLKIGQFHKAEELYIALLEQTSDDSEKAHYYNQLGYAKNDQGEYEKAIEYYERALELRHKNPTSDQTNVATTYNNIAAVYDDMKEYSKALSFYEKDLEICNKNSSSKSSFDWLLPTTTSLRCITTWKSTRKHFHFTKKQLKSNKKLFLQIILRWPLPTTTSVWVYQNMKEYSKALSFYEKALEILQKTLPPNHPLLATSYCNIAYVYGSMEQYSKALSHFERALDISQRSLPPNHPSIQDVRESIEIVKKKL